MSGDAKQRCALCGKFLSDDNSYYQPDKINRYTPYCIYCQPRVYTERAALIGFKLAMFTCCLEFNMPYLPELLEEAQQMGGSKGIWKGYVAVLNKYGYHKEDGKIAQFKDGLTDIKKAFDGNTNTIFVDDEMLTAEDYAESLKAQTVNWGYGPDENPYNQEDYDYLDEQYQAMSEGRGYISAQTDLTIKQISEYKLAAKRCMAKGEYANAKSINSMVKELMESEQLRKKDELPQDRARLDDIVLAVERAGLPIMDCDELGKFLADHSLHKKYPYTRDAADQVLLMIRNATAWNEGVAEVTSLPPSFQIADDLGEFAEEPDETEKKLYKEFSLSRADSK